MDYPSPEPLSEREMWHDYCVAPTPAKREAIVLRYSRLVYNIVNRIVPAQQMREDCCQVGMIGLIKAVDRFDPRRGYRFTTYAAPTVIGEVLRYFRDSEQRIGISRVVRDAVNVLDVAADLFVHEVNRMPESDEELASFYGCDVEDIWQVRASAESRFLVELDAVFDFDPEGGKPGMGVDISVSDVYPVLESYPELHQAIEMLSDGRMRYIIRRRHLDGATQTQVGKELGLSQMHISRLERRALGLLRASLVGGPVQENRVKRSRKVGKKPPATTMRGITRFYEAVMDKKRSYLLLASRGGMRREKSTPTEVLEAV